MVKFIREDCVCVERRTYKRGVQLIAVIATFMTLHAQTTFEEWRAQNFTGANQTNDAVSGLLATPQNDGFTNLAKYALGLSVDELPATSLPAITSTVPLSVNFIRPTGLTDVSYAIQYTSDLTNPTSWVGASLSVAPISGDSTRERVSAVDPLNNQPLRFTRIRIIHSSGVSAEPPRNLAVTAEGSTGAILTFDESAGAGGYLVEALTPQGVYEIIGFVPAGSTSYNVSGLIPERESNFRVRAVGGDSSVTDASEAVSVTTEFGDQGAVILKYSNDVPGADNLIGFGIVLENSSDEAIPLNELSIRYWLTNEGGPIGAQYFQNSVNPTITSEDAGAQIDVNTVELNSPTPEADAYVEFALTRVPGDLEANTGRFAISGQMHRVNFVQPFTASNDYSFGTRGSGGNPGLVVNPLMGIYRNGELIFGLPPGGGSVGGPEAPTALRARPMSESAIELTWEDSITNNEALYVIERDFAEDAAGFSLLTTTEANSIQFQDSQLLDEAEYTYRVRAVNQNGVSALTNLATTSTLPGTSPQFIPVAPETLNVASFSDGRLDLNWSDSSRNERGFVIERSEAGGPFEQIAEVSRGITSYIDFGLEASTNYSYRVRAFNLAGDRASSASDGVTEESQAETAPTDVEIIRFLRQATFGATPDLVEEVRTMGFSDWLDAQFDPGQTIPSLHQAATAAAVAASGADLGTPEGAITGQIARQNVWWDRVLTSPDQVRQRLAFALSQIIVISQNDPDLTPEPEAMAKFYDLFVNVPESNYRELLEDVTFSPVMGMYLDHTRNQRANTATNVRPDENYAREIMQLFSIGLIQRNLDGTAKLDGDGNPLPTYNQRDIEQMARVFTGLTYAGSTENTFFTAEENYFDPMIMVPAFHDTGSKNFQLLNSDIDDIPAGQDPLQDLEDVHDGLANHSSVAPFLCRQLIQRTVTSNPSSAYVERIAAVFEDNGEGQRGDFAAVFKAILLDYEARSADPLDSLTYGKQREPIIRLATLLRALDSTPGTDGVNIGDLTFEIQQAPLRAPSVFNFFDPTFSLPGAINDQGLDSPEFQTSQSSTVLQSINLAGNIIFEDNFGGLTRDFSRYNDASLTNEQLLDLIEMDLMDGRMPDAMRMIINGQIDNLAPDLRARVALYLVMSSAEFNIEQ